MRSLIVEGTQAVPLLRVGDLPQPSPAPGIVLVRVFAAGLMPSELDWPSTWFQESGAKRLNTVPAHEFAGTVETAGPDVTSLKVGDEVFGMNGWYADGGMAEYCLAPSDALALKPRTLTYGEAATVPISALTAWQALFDHGRLQAGERVLVHGGAGAVGNYVIQFAKQRGAFVIATASAQNRGLVLKLGADKFIDYRTQRFEDGADQVHLVVDTVGGETLDRSWKVLTAGGRLVTVASSSAGSDDERVRKSFFIVEPRREQLVHIASVLNAGLLKIFVKTEIDLADAADFYLGQARAEGTGKIVVRV